MSLYGIGIDLVEIDRFERALDRFGDRILQRLFTEPELDYALRQRRPGPHLAARFAAKEALLKALGSGLRHGRWTEIEVQRDLWGRPSLQLFGRIAAEARKRGAGAIHLSLTHTHRTAQAQVVIEGRRESPDVLHNG